MGSTVNAVKSKMPASKTMNFSGNNDNNIRGPSMTTSVTHDEHLNFGGDPDGIKKDLTNK